MRERTREIGSRMREIGSRMREIGSRMRERESERARERERAEIGPSEKDSAKIMGNGVKSKRESEKINKEGWQFFSHVN